MQQIWLRFFDDCKLQEMQHPESLEEFYQRKFEWIPEEIRKDIGHFNLFRLEPIEPDKPMTIPYRRRDFYKIMLVKGNSRVHYADQVVEVKRQALCFSNPQIPYKWEHLDGHREGIYCIFNSLFFYQFGQFQQYEVFQPGAPHVFELSDDQAQEIMATFLQIEEEFNSGYKYKFDSIRNHLFALLHFALKLEPSALLNASPPNAAQRISMLFMELLERQFPIDDNHPSVNLRSPSDFAEQLNVHVNHLNRAIRETTQKTTSQVIAERILQEARVLLRQTAWNVSEIAFALGFREVTHFNNFFKKHMALSPSKFRQST